MLTHAGLHIHKGLGCVQLSFYGESQRPSTKLTIFRCCIAQHSLTFALRSLAGLWPQYTCLHIHLLVFDWSSSSARLGSGKNLASW